jgi:hypothetical protein
VSSIPAWLLLLVCLASVLGAAWLGLRAGRRVPPERKPEAGHLGTVQGALLGLLALLMGFAFSGAMGRFFERQDALYREANAIENAWDRVALLSNRDEVRAELAAYVRRRLELFRTTDSAASAELEKQLAAHYASAMRAALVGAAAAPALGATLITGVEAVGDELTRRQALTHRHLPGAFVLVMVSCASVSMAVVGFGAGVVDRRSPFAVAALGTMIALALFITFDFDVPRRGLIRLDPAPLERTAATLGAATPR